MPGASHRQMRFPVGTKYVLESRGPFVRRYVEFPNGNRIQLTTRKALTCKCAERQTSIVPEHKADTLEVRTLRQRIVAYS
jgi:hypothetical protein